MSVPIAVMTARGESALVLKLRQFVELSSEEAAILGALGTPRRRLPPGETLVEQGAGPVAAVLLHDGWAIRHRTLRDGRRQIIDFLLPGDLCDPSSFVTTRADFSVTAISPVTCASVEAQEVLALLTRSPRLGAMLWWLESQEEFVMRAHLVAVGRLSAYERVAYLIWELWTRLRAVHRAHDHSFEMQATQDMIADATGLSQVHVSRTLNRLERAGVIQRAERQYRILEPAQLMALAQVDEQRVSSRLPERIARLLENRHPAGRAEE